VVIAAVRVKATRFVLTLFADASRHAAASFRTHAPGLPQVGSFFFDLALGLGFLGGGGSMGGFSITAPHTRPLKSEPTAPDLPGAAGWSKKLKLLGFP